jgi:endo-1,3(4)-beta-glucanase
LTNPAFCGASGDCAGPAAGTACTATQGCLAGACVAACAPVPLDLDTPFDTATPPFSTRPGQQVPSGYWGSSAAPLPTNASWENLVLGSGGSRVDLLPYQVKAESDWLAVGNGAPVATALDASIPDQVQLRLGALKTGSFTNHKVTAYDLLSVTLIYTAAGGTMTAPLVEGMPYVTVDYAGLKPMLLPGSYTFTSVNGSTVAGAATGTRFKVQLSDGTTWIVYASAPLTFDWSAGSMAARAAITGTLRVANAPDAASIAALDTYASAVPTGGSVGVSVGCDQATLRFTYTTRGTGQLLMAALPHHLARLSAYSSTALTFRTLRGTLLGVVGSGWEQRIPLTTTGWQAPRPVATAHLDVVRSALLADASYAPPASVSTDPYFGGKYLAKLARLALIADELGETATATTLRARLAPLAAAWLEGTNGNPLVYDTTWGGVVTSNGLANPSVDFGQGYYNDHHFHYGYHLYAAAALARLDSAFLTAPHRQALLALVRDIANPSASDPKFPRFRHTDLFRGHSWASGLAENAEGRDQESSSEAINAWYGLHLLGLASGDARMSDLGRVLLALETDSARTYWQVTDPSAIYRDPFAQNRCVGRLYETRVTFDTFFGTEPWKVYGIQMLPYTPASEALLSPAWITDAWSTMVAKTTGAPQEWAGLLTMAHATVARELAWTDATALTAWDDGNSNTNTLWWIATRP